MRNILIGIGVGIPVMIFLAWIVATIGEGNILLAGGAFFALLGIGYLVGWLFKTLLGFGRWARRQ